MTTVAEGTDTDSQLAALSEMDGEKGKGYLLSRPVCGDAFSQWLLREAQLA